MWDIFKWPLLALLIIFGTYSLFRVISIAVFTSWWELKNFYNFKGEVKNDESK